MANKRLRVCVDTSNTCFLCFEEINNTGSEEMEVNSSSYGVDKYFSLLNIIRHLAVNLNEVHYFSKKPSAFLKRADVQVNLCRGCSPLLKRFSEHYKAMEVCKMKVESSLEAIWSRVKKSSEGGDNHSKIVKELRQEVIQKCKRKVPEFQPKIILKRTERTLNNERNILGVKTGPNNDTSIPSEVGNTEDGGSSDESSEEEEGEFDMRGKFLSPNCQGDFGFRQKSGPHECPHCGKVFRVKCFLERHLPYHMNKEEWPCICEHCSRRFPNTNVLAAHIRKMHSESGPPQPIPCEICGKSYSSLYNLKTHQILIHNVPGKKKSCYNCKVCGASYKSQAGLRGHALVHKQPDQAFACTFPGCDKKYPHKSTLKRHMAFHSDQRPFACEHCDKRYKDKSDLNQHAKRVHSGLPGNHICEFCAKTFHAKSNLNMHQKQRHREELEERLDFAETSTSYLSSTLEKKEVNDEEMESLFNSCMD